MPAQNRWQRMILLGVLGYEGAGALLGGGLLMARPDGRYMDMPVRLMHGTFRDFLIPGAILFALGILNVAAFVGVLRRRRWDWPGAVLAVGGWSVWFLVEIAIVRELHWLQVMWGFPVILGGVAAVSLLPFRPAIMREVWLLCGLVSSLLYVAMNLIVPRQWPGFDPASRVISELSAVGAPTRPLWVVLGLFYTLLVVAFGWGIRMSAGGERRLGAAGVLIVAYGALGFIWPFAPMHLREVLASGGGTFSDTMHIALGVVTEVIYLLALGLAASSLGRAFRLYSVLTVVTLLAFAALTFREAPLIGHNGPTPFIGVWERINIGVFLLWMSVLAISLLGRGRTMAIGSRRGAAGRVAAQPAELREVGVR
jgi:hypothetical protein